MVLFACFCNVVKFTIQFVFFEELQQIYIMMWTAFNLVVQTPKKRGETLSGVGWWFPFHSQEWPISNFSLQYHYIVKQTGDENKEKNQLGDLVWFNTKFSELIL